MTSRRDLRIRAAGLSVVGLILPILPLSGCDAVQRTDGSIPDTYTFILGPRSGPGSDQRLRVTMPRDYLELTSEDARKQSVELGQFTFALHYKEKRKAARQELGSPDVVVFTIAWEPIDGVKRRVDGSWTNYFSRYRPSSEGVFSLKTLLPPEPNNKSKLYVTEDERTIIECSYPAKSPDGSCHLLSNSGNNLTIEAVFRSSLLDRWQEILRCGRDSISKVEKSEGKHNA